MKRHPYLEVPHHLAAFPLPLQKSVGSPGRIIQDIKYSAPEPPLGRGGEGGGVGGGGSREEEARNPPPGSSSARRRSEALLSLGDPRRFRAAPARPGEARGESGGRRPAPRPPAAAESPGPAGAGRGGAWERPAGGGGLGARGGGGAGSPSGSDQLARSLRGALSGAGQPRAGPSPASSGAISLGADAGAFPTHSDSTRTREEGDCFLPSASLAAKKPAFVFEVWRDGRRRCRQLKPEEGIIRASCGGFIKTLPPWPIIGFPGPASPRSLVWNYYPFCCVAAFPPNVDSKGLAPSL